MEQRPPWEANSFSASQIPRIVWSPEPINSDTSCNAILTHVYA